MVDRYSISLVMPCLNEEAGLKLILSSIPSFIDEVIVVDNGSIDKSVEVANNFGVTVLIEEVKGYGKVLRRGINAARGDVVAIMDGDGSYSLDNLYDICIYMGKGNFDFISGSRFPLANRHAMPFLNIVANRIITVIICFLFKINIKDSQSGMMVFRRGLLDKICLSNDGMGFSQEFKIRSWLNSSLKCTELRIPYKPRLGKVKFNKIRDSFSNLRGVLLLYKEFKMKSLCVRGQKFLAA